MSTIFNLAGMTASDYQFANQANADLIYEATRAYLDTVNAAAMASMDLFVSGTTTNYKERYQLPMSGRMQEVTDGNKPLAQRRSGSWDVAYPLKEFGIGVNYTRDDFAYMTPAEFQSHIDGAATMAATTKRYEILNRLFDNTSDTFEDKRWGSLTIEGLANGDSVVYPPVLGSTSEATEDHYLTSGYAASAISDTNNPISTLVGDLIHHYSRRTGGVNIVSLINPAQLAKIEALTGFTDKVPSAINPGQDTSDLNAIGRNVPGEIVGYTSGSYVAVWDFIPANYVLSVHLEAPQPLKMRVDASGTGFVPGGLQLMGRIEDYPMTYNNWSLRFGIGASNRLSAAVMFLDSGSTYTAPAVA